MQSNHSGQASLGGRGGLVVGKVALPHRPLPRTRACEVWQREGAESVNGFGLSPVTTLASCETLTLILRHRLASLLLVQASNAAGI